MRMPRPLTPPMPPKNVSGMESTIAHGQLMTRNERAGIHCPTGGT